MHDKQQHVMSIKLTIYFNNSNVPNQDALRIYITRAQVIMTRGVFEDAAQSVNTWRPIAQ